ncbi:MAG: hypothetical protein ABSF38_03310 [Verrucomicrobiota bacterium]|jgi:hypothetical protein
MFAHHPPFCSITLGPSCARLVGSSISLHSTLSTPFLQDGYVYGVCSYGQLRCLKAATGERILETLSATTADGKEMRETIGKLSAWIWFKNERRRHLTAGDAVRRFGYFQPDCAEVTVPSNRDNALGTT